MAYYKRNQIEEAISDFFSRKASKPTRAMRTRIKRLLETDRDLGRKGRSRDPECANFAFFSSDAPGRGTEVLFSSYEAFAVTVALVLLQHAWPQSFAVSVLRKVRPMMEREHRRILQQDPAVLFDKEAIRKQARPGAVVVHNTDPVFLRIALPADIDQTSPDVEIYRGGDELYAARKDVAGSWVFFELVSAAHALQNLLAKTEPKKRGR
jgi:hypothetical protein